jgi:hypothetical protein
MPFPLHLLLDLTCTYLVVYISIRVLCSHRHTFIFYASSISHSPFPVLPPTFTPNSTNAAKPILSMSLTDKIDAFIARISFVCMQGFGRSVPHTKATLN